MPIDFHAAANRRIYTSRTADPGWKQMIAESLDIQGSTVLDLGCGGGVYSRAFIEMGAVSVTAKDFSQEMLRGAAEQCRSYPAIRLVQGSALHTGLENNSIDIVLARALVHHLSPDEVLQCFQESCRILKPQGCLIVQDRTVEDCLLPGSSSHLRGYFFELYPELMAKEKQRRHAEDTVLRLLHQSGLTCSSVRYFREIRRVYDSPEGLQEDLLRRAGRSILFDLDDSQLQTLSSYIADKLKDEDTITDQDSWTVWMARKAQ